ncbi:MAG: hypothetical protein NZ777_10030, partial [Pseudomonadales bacterium]|nr:hypothetical protein [Pseudomonadales bacterium]
SVSPVGALCPAAVAVLARGLHTVSVVDSSGMFVLDFALALEFELVPALAPDLELVLVLAFVLCVGLAVLGSQVVDRIGV